MLGRKYENEQLRNQVTQLGKELEKRAKTTKMPELKPETPDEQVIMLQEEVKNAEKTLESCEDIIKY